MNVIASAGDWREPRGFLARHRLAVVALLLLAGWLSFPPAAPAPLLTITETKPAQSVNAFPSNPDLIREIARQNQESFRLRVEAPAAVEPIAANMAGSTSDHSPSDVSIKNFSAANYLVAIIAFGLLGGLILRLFATPADSVTESSVRRSTRLPAAPELCHQVRAEEAAFAAFVENFKVATPVRDSDATVAANLAGRDFLERATEQVATLREAFRQVAHAGARQKQLAECHRQIRQFTTDIGLANFAPVRQLATGLEGLLKQVADHPKNCTPSALRTAHAAIELLFALARPGPAADAATAADARILVVDDDLISRNALAFALKRVFPGPELAASGKDALALAGKQTFDLIFLDVQMPEMDGFELCSRLHFTETNRTTPVVFVTCMDDFDSRAKAVRVGGMDLLGKPFLTFEVIVKALTLIFRNRLQGQLPEIEPVEFVLAPEAAGPEEIICAEPAPAAAPPAEELSLAITAEAPLSPAADSSEPSVEDLAAALAVHITANIATLQSMWREMSVCAAATEQTDQLGDFYMLLHSLTINLDLARLEQAAELSAAVETLAKKLTESPAHRTPSALHTVADALILLAELCAAPPPAAPDSWQPIELLVLDADVTSRRQTVSALQTVFEKPASEEEVAAALALAREKSFDVIFMALQLPGVDGFAIGAKIHEAPANHQTPLVFLAGESDYEVYAETIRSEGLEVIAKPVLPVEISVKALTLARRHHRALVREDSPDPADLAVS